MPITIMAAISNKAFGGFGEINTARGSMSMKAATKLTTSHINLKTKIE
jgi:hypothetical protein